METKYCRKCQEWKPESEFYKNTRGGCKRCVQAYHKEWKRKKYPPKPKLIDSGLRRCSKCHEVKSLDGFYRDKDNVSGYQHRCKVCSDTGRKVRKQRELEAKRALQEVIPEGYKKCGKCKSILPVSNFPQGKNGAYHSPCKTCKKDYRLQNRDKINERQKQYQTRPEVRERTRIRTREWIQNSQEYQAKQRTYRAEYRQRPHVKAKDKAHNTNYRSRPENQAKARTNTIEWRKANPERASIQTNVKRVRKLQAEGGHTAEQWKQLLSFFKCCPRCGEDKPLTRDHIIPLSKGGTDYIDNIVPLCRSCNSAKNAHLIIDYRPREVRRWAFAEMSFVYQC